MDSEKYEKLVGLATELVEQVRAEALVSLRFLDVALYKLKFRFDVNTSLYTDGEFLYMNPYYIFSLYKSEDNMLLRSYLHVILHCIFFHLFIDKNVDKDRWDLACDICVENIINELNLPTLLEDNKNPQIGELNILKVKVTELTAEKLYNYFMVYGITDDELKRLQVLFKRDEHDFWYLDTGNIGSKEGKKKKDDNYKEQNKNETNDEKVTFYLIGSTTENPSFQVVPALLSRVQVIMLEPLEDSDIKAIIKTPAAIAQSIVRPSGNTICKTQ